MLSNKPKYDWKLKEWLCYLEEKSPLHQIKLGLERVLSVAHSLDIVELAAKVITVAGTNGKGSTVNALEHLYHHAGYKVGSYTSPHLIHFNERIKVNLAPISDQHLCELFYHIEFTQEELDLSYFEMTTLAALLHFKKMELDVVILEVGLGGRLDAVNIIDADLAIITTIDYDHQEYLGTTLDEIGFEKAGILRKNKPFIYADNNPPNSILKRSKELHTENFLLLKDYCFSEHDLTWEFNWSQLHLSDLNKPNIQLKSASAAILATRILEPFLPVPTESIYKAMNTINVPGRLQFTLLDNVHILYDVSHNTQSVQLLTQTIKKYNDTKNKLARAKASRDYTIHAVFAALKDKDSLNIFHTLKNSVDCWHLAQLDTPRTAGVDYLLSQAKKAEILSALCYTNPLIAFKAALAQSDPGDLIVVFGSFFTVGQVLSSQNELVEEKEII